MKNCTTCKTLKSYILVMVSTRTNNTRNMSYYTCTDQDALVVPIKNILSTKPIRDIIYTELQVQHFSDLLEIRSFCSKVKKGKSNFTSPLNRFQEMHDLMTSGIALPPINVAVHGFGDEEYYEIIDGRHRFAVSVVLNFKEIPIKIVS